MTLICRVCLSPCYTNHFSLFLDPNEINIYLKIMACSNVKIKREDGYPTAICSQCYDMLNTAYEFKRKCEASDFKLRNGLSIKVFKEEEVDVDDDVIYADNFSDKQSPAYDGYYSDTDMKPFNNDEDLKPLSVFVKETKSKNDKQQNRKKVKIKKESKEVDIKCEEDEICIVNHFEINKIEDFIPVEIKIDNDDDDFVWKETETFEDEVEKIEKSKTLVLEMRKKNKELRIHKVKKKNVDEPDHQINLCDMCGEVFKSKSHLTHHKKVKHDESENGLIKCKHPECTKTFKVPHYMNRHLKRCHSGKKEFICNECGKQYVFISSLRQHMKVHSGTFKMKSCTFCSQKYKTQKSVEIHIRSVHTGERPAICKICDSAFFHEDYLKEHMRLHTGETPFKCPICKRGYAQRGNMKSHMKQHRLSELDDVTKATMKPNYLKLLRDC